MNKVWAVLMSRGPERGTWQHLLGSMGAALVLGLAFWFVRANT
jgi:hypothetical protein